MTDRDRRFSPGTDRELTAFERGLTPSEAEFAADLSAVQADDALLDALGGSDPKMADDLGDQELNALLLAWRRDIDSEPLAELVDVDTAVVTVKTAALARKHGGRRRLLVPVAAAAAVLAIAFAGTGLAAKDAQPGDTLWGLTKVLYADHARSVEAAAAAKLDLEKANLALAGGRLDDARKALDEAQAALSQVTDEENRDQLLEQHRQLSAQLQNPGQQPLPPDQQSPSQTPVATTPQPTPQPTAPPTSLPGGGNPGTTLPGTTTPSPTPPTTTSEPPPPTTSTTPPASGNDPGGSRNEPSPGAGAQAPAGAVETP
ncbi:anti-sigma-D factor RsdA [Amycolatopsis sp. EV170708-02-1]|uniref:anti-sigma-D factor RsdA n=1 Tax=Amycolatopsis sp. EV170708-02-1 TaxID=2919322 RepID=UPI001F0C6378|nr:anti-sigma-D factor RsdA [Amycolatopsis sp. EV170708-02-1]UMP02095.1 anti-sigma-D factor RsdA [Amycolatopsis sp. EV170708-02-1]